MVSDQKVFNTKVVRLVETVNFAFGVIIIRHRMQPAETKQDQAVFSFEKSEWNPSEWNIAIWVKSFRVVYCHLSEILPSGILPSEWNPSEWNIAIRVKSFWVKIFTRPTKGLQIPTGKIAVRVRNFTRPTKGLQIRVNQPEGKDCPIWSSRWSRMEKWSTWKLFVMSKRSTLLLRSLSSEIVYGPQRGYNTRTVQPTTWPSPIQS